MVAHIFNPPALKRQRQEDLWVQSWPDLHSNFQDEKPWLKKTKTFKDHSNQININVTQRPFWITKKDLKQFDKYRSWIADDIKESSLDVGVVICFKLEWFRVFYCYCCFGFLFLCLFVFLAFWARLSSHYVALLAWNTASQVLELKLSFLDVIMELWF